MGVRAVKDFETFVEERSAALLGVAYLLTGDRGHAEDLLQTALLRVLRRWPSARAAPEAYTRQVLVNLARDRHRNRLRRPQEIPLPPDPDVLRGNDLGLDQVADRDLVARSVASLPLQQRRVIVLRFFADLSVDQTAETLRCSPGTVKSSTARGLARLRDLLTRTNPNDTQSERSNEPQEVFRARH